MKDSIKELQQDKISLENEIYKLIDTFQEKYGVEVEEISTVVHEDHCGLERNLIGIDIIIKL